MTVIATSLATTRHLVRVVHSATGEAIAAVRVAPLAWPTGWWARVVDGTVVVAATGDAAGPAAIDIVITDGLLASALKLPAPQPGQPLNSVRVPLAAAAVDVPVDPADMVLTVVLRSDTGPSVGRAVTVRAASGTPTVTLAEGTPGTYSSPARQWGANLVNADLRVGTTNVRKVSMDYSRVETRIHAVDPT